MCGSTGAEDATSAAQADFYNQLTSSYKTEFSQFGNIANALTSTFTPILQAGPGQEGFSAAEKNALNSNATENTASQYGNAAQAIAQQGAAQGGGNAFLPSGVTQQLQAQNANAAAGSLASAKNTIVQNDYAQGQQNWLTAAQELGSTASMLNPTGFANAATGAGSAASTTENNIANQANSLWQAGIGAAGGLAGGVTYSGAKGWGLGG